ncbi:MAG: YggS family pyridoxal phosphate-dependent enzyme [Bacilli bacterium]|nr:YggS family pyridoxal phosphate-dependent enzyme [Bacilli bacterium]
MIRKDIDQFIASIPSNITVVAATKYVNTDDMQSLFLHGITNFGENRVDAFLEKYQKLNNLKPTWHFIGHLQRNKAKEIINKIDYLHSLDSLSLAKLINEHRNSPLKCFIEVAINNEKQKNGVPIDELENFVNEVKKLSNIEIVGLMMMTVKNSGSISYQKQFRNTRLLKEQIENNCQINLPFLSMGMSDDYLEAIKEKTTHIRLGRILFDL